MPEPQEGASAPMTNEGKPSLELCEAILESILTGRARLKIEAPGPHIDAIAKVCHEVNRAYCMAIGDSSQPSWSEAPEWQRESARQGVIMHLANPNAGPEESHISWMKHKVVQGWTWGPVKDPDKKTHPCLIPFNMLPETIQAKDYIFRQIVHSLKDLL